MLQYLDLRSTRCGPHCKNTSMSGNRRGRGEKASWWVQHLLMLKALLVSRMRMLSPTERFLSKSARFTSLQPDFRRASPPPPKIYFNSTNLISITSHINRVINKAKSVSYAAFHLK